MGREGGRGGRRERGREREGGREGERDVIYHHTAAKRRSRGSRGSGTVGSHDVAALRCKK